MLFGLLYIKSVLSYHRAHTRFSIDPFSHLGKKYCMYNKATNILFTFSLTIDQSMQPLSISLSLSFRFASLNKFFCTNAARDSAFLSTSSYTTCVERITPTLIIYYAYLIECLSGQLIHPTLNSFCSQLFYFTYLLLAGRQKFSLNFLIFLIDFLISRYPIHHLQTIRKPPCYILLNFTHLSHSDTRVHYCQMSHIDNSWLSL